MPKVKKINLTGLQIDFGMFGERLQLGTSDGISVIVEHEPVYFVTVVFFQVHVQTRAQYKEHHGRGGYYSINGKSLWP